MNYLALKENLNVLWIFHAKKKTPRRSNYFKRGQR